MNTAIIRSRFGEVVAQASFSIEFFFPFLVITWDVSHARLGAACHDSLQKLTEPLVRDYTQLGTSRPAPLVRFRWLEPQQRALMFIVADGAVPNYTQSGTSDLRHTQPGARRATDTARGDTMSHVTSLAGSWGTEKVAASGLAILGRSSGGRFSQRLAAQPGCRRTSGLSPQTSGSSPTPTSQRRAGRPTPPPARSQ